jgi:PAS domain S-box-containing protein
VSLALGALFEASRWPVIVVEHDGRIVTANQAVIAQYGWSLAELVTMNIRDLQAAERREIPADLDRAFRGDASPLDRRPHRRRDGSVVWVVPAAGPITVDGETYIVSALQDVTTALTAEQRARDASERALVERQLLLDAIVAMLAEPELSPSLAALARSFTQAIRGSAATVWLPERKGSRVLRAVAWHDLPDESRSVIDGLRIDLDRERCGRLAWETGKGQLLHASELQPGTVEHTAASRLGVGVVAALTGRNGPHGLLYALPKQEEDLSPAIAVATTLGTFAGMVLEALQLEARADVMWRAASEQLSDGIVLLDPQLRVLRINSAERRLLGPDRDPIGKPCSETFQICARPGPCAHRVALTERRRQVLEIIGTHTKRPLRVEIIPTEDNDANVAVIHVARDLTEERATRTQLLTTERLASIGRLAAGVAHEINNPAAFVTVNLGVLRDRFLAGTARSEDVIAMLDDSLNGMDRIRDIVRDLKGFARDRAVAVVDLGTIVQSALRMATHETRGRGRIERVSEEGTVARVRGARLAQVVLNLVLNAAQALPAGRAENRISVRTRRVGDRARIEVADNGPGIDAATAPRIFEPFFTTREESGGTGLGLWLARSIVEEEGGALTFRPEPGGGVCFVVDLPAAPLDPFDSERHA